MRKRTKRKVRKFFRIIFLALVVLIALYIFVFKPGNPFTTNINLGDSEVHSKFEIRKIALLSMKEFLKVPAKLDGITFNEDRSAHERREWAKIYHKNPNDVIVMYMKFTTYKDAEKKDYQNNQKYRTSWVFVKDKKRWIFKSKQ